MGAVDEFDGPQRRAGAGRLRAPGRAAVKDFSADDGDHISLVTFTSHDALLAWRDHPDHVATQRLGRDHFYASYSVQVCEVVRAYDFTAPGTG